MEPVSSKAMVDIEAPLERFFYWFTSIDVSRIMNRYGPLPAVIGIRDQTGPMHVAGSSRVLVLSDGTTTIEETMSCDPPNELIYQILGIDNSFRYLVTGGRGELKFSENQKGGTRVEWQYFYFGRSIASTLVLKVLIPIFWKGFMQSALTRTKHIAEEELTNNQ